MFSITQPLNHINIECDKEGVTMTKISLSRGTDSSANLGTFCGLKGHRDKRAFDVLQMLGA